MPQPAKSRTVSPSTHRPSAARCPTRRRRRRPSSRPGRRSGRGPCPRSRRSARPRPSVGVPPTAADGCSASASCRDEVDSSVLGVVHDAGDVGGEVHDVGQVQHERRLGDVHRRSSAAPARRRPSGRRTRAPRGPCDERASVAASAMSRSSSPVRRMVPASTREVTRPRSRRTSISGVAPNMPSTWKVQHMGYVAASRCSGHRTSTSVDGGGHEVAGQHDLLELAGADPGDRVRDHGHPLLAVEGAVREAHGRGQRRMPVAASGSLDLADGGEPGPARRGGRPRPGAAPAPSRRARRRTRRSRSRPGRCRARRPRRCTVVRAIVSDHHLCGVREPGRARRSDHRRHAPADQALAPAQPGDGSHRTAAGRPALRRREVQRHGPGDEVSSSEGARVVTRQKPTPQPRDPRKAAVSTGRRSPCRRRSPGRRATPCRCSRAR